MDNRDFVVQTFLDTHQTICRLNTNTGMMEFIQHDEPDIPLNQPILLKQYVNDYLNTHLVHASDQKNFEWLLDLEQLRQKCIQHDNGILFSYRRYRDSEMIWTRIIISVPLDYSKEQPDILVYRRDMSTIEANGQDVVRVVNNKVEKILKCDLLNKTFHVIKIRKSEEFLKNRRFGARYHMGEQLIEEEFVHPEDLAEFCQETNFECVINHFADGYEEKSVYYRRKIGSIYRWVKLTIFPASEYSISHPVFIYIIEDVHRAMNGFVVKQGKQGIVSHYSDESEGLKRYYDSIMHVMSFFTQNYENFYMIDLEKNQFINYKFNREMLKGNSAYAGVYSELIDQSIRNIPDKRDVDLLRNYDTVEKVKDALIDKVSLEYEFTNADGKRVKAICTKAEEIDGIPTKVMCRIIYVEKKKKLKVKTFGNFEVYDETGQPIIFKKKKSKQLLAYLIDKYGYPMTTKDVVVDVLERPMDDLNAKKYVSTLARSAAIDLKNAGYEDIIIKEWNSLRVDVEKLDCDYYHLIEGEVTYWQNYHNEYMKEYSWAEETNAEILHYSSL